MRDRRKRFLRPRFAPEAVIQTSEHLLEMASFVKAQSLGEL
jgi:hypothetical protein